VSYAGSEWFRIPLRFGFILRVGITISHDEVKQFFLRFIQEVKVLKVIRATNIRNQNFQGEERIDKSVRKRLKTIQS
jgi:hypothetical protein